MLLLDVVNKLNKNNKSSMRISKLKESLINSSYLFTFVALLFVMAISTLLSESFLSGDNLITILRQASVLMILSSGLTAVILTGGIDLSVNNTAALVGCIVAHLLLRNINIIVVVLIGLLIGLIVGLFNGFLVGVLQLPPFVATYGSNMVVLGLATIVMQGAVIYDLPRNFTPIGVGYFGPIPIPVIISALLIIVIAIILQKTTLGRNIYMLGSNPAAALYSGQKTVLITLQAYALSGLTAALGGIVMTARLNAADANMGNSYGLQIVAAVVMGGTSLLGGEGGIFGTVIGAIILTIIINIMNLIGINSYLQSLAVGLVIIITVWFDIFSRKQREQRKASISL